MAKILIICGPTATGKTRFGIDIAKRFNGELVSADSRQVYKGKNLIYGKDLPRESKWVDNTPGYWDLGYTKIWLYDVVSPGEEFSVAQWHDLAVKVIEDILSRQKLPIVVGGSGLYIKSLIQNLTDISVPRDMSLRKDLENKSIDYLFNYLKRIDPQRAKRLNESDRKNPRRLFRAIEIAALGSKVQRVKGTKFNFLQIGLTTAREELLKRVDMRVEERIKAGAAGEDSILSANPQLWRNLEHKIVRQQLTWFKKQPAIYWFDITQPAWSIQAQYVIKKWYNKLYAPQG